ncbi:MAG: hypothetical protein E6Q83_03755 [Thiothrix sp.]|nr:MAG: hypothetical protein E6Q83_03755 [Thiothrix sp.]
MSIKQKRETEKILGRKGIAKRIHNLAYEIIKASSYQEVMELAGRISVLADTASYDSYWSEKVSNGKFKECGNIDCYNLDRSK